NAYGWRSGWCPNRCDDILPGTCPPAPQGVARRCDDDRRYRCAGCRRLEPGTDPDKVVLQQGFGPAGTDGPLHEHSGWPDYDTGGLQRLSGGLRREDAVQMDHNVG